MKTTKKNYVNNMFARVAGYTHIVVEQNKNTQRHQQENKFYYTVQEGLNIIHEIEHFLY